jgi:hypothetical protein
VTGLTWLAVNLPRPDLRAGEDRLGWAASLLAPWLVLGLPVAGV